MECNKKCNLFNLVELLNSEVYCKFWRGKFKSINLWTRRISFVCSLLENISNNSPPVVLWPIIFTLKRSLWWNSPSIHYSNNWSTQTLSTLIKFNYGRFQNLILHHFPDIFEKESSVDLNFCFLSYVNFYSASLIANKFIGLGMFGRLEWGWKITQKIYSHAFTMR